MVKISKDLQIGDSGKILNDLVINNRNNSLSQVTNTSSKMSILSCDTVQLGHIISIQLVFHVTGNMENNEHFCDINIPSPIVNMDIVTRSASDAHIGMLRLYGNSTSTTSLLTIGALQSGSWYTVSTTYICV